MWAIKIWTPLSKIQGGLRLPPKSPPPLLFGAPDDDMIIHLIIAVEYKTFYHFLGIFWGGAKFKFATRRQLP